MLKHADYSYVGVAESATWFTLGQAKEELLTVIGLQEQGSSLEFLRRGYKLQVIVLISNNLFHVIASSAKMLLGAKRMLIRKSRPHGILEAPLLVGVLISSANQDI